MYNREGVLYNGPFTLNVLINVGSNVHCYVKLQAKLSVSPTGSWVCSGQACVPESCLNTIFSMRHQLRSENRFSACWKLNSKGTCEVICHWANPDVPCCGTMKDKQFYYVLYYLCRTNRPAGYLIVMMTVSIDSVLGENLICKCTSQTLVYSGVQFAYLSSNV